MEEDLIERQKLEEQLKELGWRLASGDEYCKFYYEKIMGNPDEEDKNRILSRMEKVLDEIRVSRMNIVPIDY